jgi:hypothetical protein
MLRRGLWAALIVALTGASLGAQPNPVVTMKVTLPDGQTKELIAPESGLATAALQDGTEYGFRPTIQDSMPWNRIVVTIFRTPTTTTPTQVVGEVEVKKGAAAVESKTTPSFKIAVSNVAAPPPAQTNSTH